MTLERHGFCRFNSKVATDGVAMVIQIGVE